MVEKCPVCGSKDSFTDYRKGEVICKGCGLVLNDRVFDFRPERRAFDEEELQKKARTGGPVKYSKRVEGLTTEIDRYNRDIRGKPIPVEKKGKWYRMRKWQKRASMTTTEDRNLSVALPELDKMCAYLHIPSNIKEECAFWYRRAVRKRIVRGRSIESVVAAIIYLICKRHRLPTTLRELEDIAGVSKKEIGRSYKVLCKRLNFKTPVLTPMDYLSRVANEINVSGATEAKAKEILEMAKKKGISAGRGPIGTAAAAIHLAGRIIRDNKCSQREIAGIWGIGGSTIRKRYKELESMLNNENN